MEEVPGADHIDVEMEKARTSVAGEVVSPPEKLKLVKLPLTRVKHIMKMDPDCNLISQDALFLVTKTTELFLEYLAKESVKFMFSGKRKTVQKRDVDAAIDNVPSLCFLDGALE